MRTKTWLITLGIILLIGFIYFYGGFKPQAVYNAGGTNRLIVADIGGVGYDMDISFLSSNKVVYETQQGANTRPILYLNEDSEPLPKFALNSQLSAGDGSAVYLYTSKIPGNRLKKGTNKLTFLYYYGDNPTLQYCLMSSQNTYNKFLSGSVNWNTDCVNPPYTNGCNLSDAYCRNDFTSAVRDTFNSNTIFSQPLGGRVVHTFNVLSQTEYQEAVKKEPDIIKPVEVKPSLLEFIKNNIFYIIVISLVILIGYLLLRKK